MIESSMHLTESLICSMTMKNIHNNTLSNNKDTKIGGGGGGGRCKKSPVRLGLTY